MALTLAFLLCLNQGVSRAAPKPRLDVRTMKDWSIVVAESAIEIARTTGRALPSAQALAATRRQAAAAAAAGAAAAALA